MPEAGLGSYILGWPPWPGAARLGMGSVERRPGQGGTLGPWYGDPDPNHPVDSPPAFRSPQAQLPNSLMSSKQTTPTTTKAVTQGVGLGQEWSHSLGDKEIFLSL